MSEGKGKASQERVGQDLAGARARLLAAVVDGSMEELGDALRLGAFEPGSEELSKGLMMAIAPGTRRSYGEMMDIARALLAAGADPERPSAGLGGALETVKKASGHAPRAPGLAAPVSPGASSPLIVAIAGANAELAELMIPRCSKLNELTGANGLTALMRACRRGSLAIAKALLAAGADPNTQTSEGRSALFDAVAAVGMGLASVGLIEALLAAGGDPLAHARDGQSALSLCSHPEGRAVLERWELGHSSEIRRGADRSGGLSL